MRFLSFLFLFVFSINLFAQSNNSGKSNESKDNAKELKRLIGRAKIHSENGNYTLAIDNYKKAIEITPSDAVLNFNLGICYKNTNADSLALIHLNKAYQINSSVDRKILFHLGLVNQLNKNFTEALSFYEKYLLEIKQRNDTTDEVLVNKLILESKSGILLSESMNDKIALFGLGNIVNSEFQENSFYILSDTAFYLSTQRPGKTGLKNDEIYLVQKTNGSWLAPVNIGKPISTVNNDVVLFAENSGNTIYFYNDFNAGDLFYSIKNNGIWGKPVQMNANINSDKTESGLAISSDGLNLIYSSSREGTIGGKDLFWCKKEGENWSSPINLGIEINTMYDEESPYFDGDTLYFSSKGHNTIGGFDVFKTHRVNNTWDTPKNMGMPINSPYDEIGFKVLGKSQWLVSNKSGGLGETDIYIVGINPNSINENKENIKPKEEVVSKVDSSKIPVKEKYLDIEPMYFNYNQHYFSAKEEKKLSKIIAYLRQNPDIKLKVVVHTDCIGSHDYNIALSKNRANEIKWFFWSKAKELMPRLKFEAVGEADPEVECSCTLKNNGCTLEQLAKNRRANFVFSK